MTKLRPECVSAGKNEESIPNDTALFLIRDSVARRRELIYGKLNDGHGRHCAIGAFWDDNPKAVLNSDLIDEVAAVNDSLGPQACAQDRWKKVNEWLRWKIAVMTGNKPRAKKQQ